MPRFHASLVAVSAFAIGFSGCSQIATPPANEPVAPQAAPTSGSDLVPDPTVVRGRLENGLRYAILPARNPRQRVSVCLLVQAGSYHERSDEPSYAHWVEHMAFRDTRDFPGDSAIQALQRLGIAFGAHVNAATGHFETDYRFNNVPTDDPTALSTGLRILRSMADGVLFNADAVKRERGVIVSESRAALGEISEAWQSRLEFLTSNGSPRWSELRVLHGKDHLVDRPWLSRTWGWNTASAEKLRAFYDRWYRPERMIVTVSGDIAPAEAEQLIRDTFASMTGRGVPPLPGEGRLPTPGSRLTPPVFVERLKFEPAVRLALSTTHLLTGPDTTASRRRSLALHLALAMLDRRLGRLAEKADTPFTESDTLVSHLVPGSEMVFVRANTPPSQWKRALSALDTELRRAGELGFSATEFERAVKISTNQAATAAATAADRSSTFLSRSLAFAVAREVVVTSAADDRALAEKHLASLTAEECRAVLRETFPEGGTAIALSGTFAGTPPNPEEVEKLLRENRRNPLAAYVAPAVARPFPFTDFGPVGRIAKREHHATLDADLIEFANGVRLNLKRTDFSRGRVQSIVRFGGGQLSTPLEKPGLDFLAFTWVSGGLRDLSREEEKAMVAGILENYSLGIGADDFRWEADGPASNVLLRLQHAAAYFVRPAFTEDTLPRELELAGLQLASYQNTASGIAQKTLSQHMSAGLWRFPAITDVRARTPAEFKAWFTPQLDGPVEITLVGDFEPEAVVDAVARTFGALPARPPGRFETRPYPGIFPPKPFADSVPFTGKRGSAVVLLAWPAAGLESFDDRLRGEILSRIFWDRVRLKLRAEMGETYSPATQFLSDDHFSPAIAYLTCSIEAAPSHRNRVATAARLVAETLAREGAGEEEFERARRPLLRQAETGLHNNAWWLDALADAQTRLTHAAEKIGAVSALARITRDETNALARAVFVKDRQSQIIVLPK